MRHLLVIAVLLGCGARPAPYTLRQFMQVHRANTPAFTVDGKRIGFLSNESGTWQAYETAIGGGAPRKLPAPPGSVGNALWSPRADEVAIMADRGGTQLYQLYLLRAGKLDRLTQHNDV